MSPQPRARAWYARRAIRVACSLIVACPLGAAAPVAAAAAEPAAGRVVVTQPPRPITDFTLTDQDGKPFRLGQLRGKPVLLFFGFTHCPDVCPMTLAKLGVLMHSAEREVQAAALVMVSVDGDRDNPEAMKAYLALALPQCIGLTGDPRTVRRINAQFSGTFFKGLPDRPGGDYLVQHTSQVYLVDAEGRLRATFFDASVDDMRRAIATLGDARPPPGTPTR